MAEKLLGIAAAAAELGVAQGTLRKWADDGLVPMVKTPTGYRRFAPETLAALKQEMRQTAGPSPRTDRPSARVVGAPVDGVTGSDAADPAPVVTGSGQDEPAGPSRVVTGIGAALRRRGRAMMAEQYAERLPLTLADAMRPLAYIRAAGGLGASTKDWTPERRTALRTQLAAARAAVDDALAELDNRS